MGKYVIRDFEALSGIKAHTIRIWEQRYRILKPERSQTNIRLYNDDELRTILNISLLNRNGYKISHVAKMGRADIEEKVRAITATNFDYQNQIDVLALSMVNMDEVEFTRIVNVNIAHLGFEAALEEVVFPFLRNIGVMWQTGTIHSAQEHFISNLVRQKLIAAIDRHEFHDGTVNEKSLLFLPEGELHELALLYLNYLLKKTRRRVMYLGQTVRFEDVLKSGEAFNPDLIMSVFTSFPRHQDIAAILSRLSNAFPASSIYISGLMLKNYKGKIPSNTQLVREISGFRPIIQEFRSSQQHGR
jgi:DNA-binding transcriptional MerR regulator